MPTVFRSKLLYVMCAFLLPAGLANAGEPNYVSFFKAGNGSYSAYLDVNNIATDAAGNRLVNVKSDSFNDALRVLIKKYWPGGEGAAYSIKGYSVDCSGQLVGGHQLVYYDDGGLPLTSPYDYGGHMAAPIVSSMDYDLMRKVCGQ
jgi:hypothetical protein